MTKNARLIEEHWVNQPMRVKISDGRIFEGLFICVDHEKNIILGETVETMTNGHRKPSGLVMLPGTHVEQCFILKKNHVTSIDEESAQQAAE